MVDIHQYISQPLRGVVLSIYQSYDNSDHVILGESVYDIRSCDHDCLF